ncbi:MAG: flagellar biosynthesis repressor FlbT [Candidatus Eisenbacteria bacterium]|nr:flagellar biosynthesis repressor FlbT [Candidatus Eisenbacteria bacterium]
MALRLTLKPNERVIIGGAVLRNGAGRTWLLIENQVPVLRGSDILSPQAVRTPCERIYLALQLMYVDPENAVQHEGTFRELVSEVCEAAPSCHTWIDRVQDSVARGQLYQALKAARVLLEHERELMSNVS